VSSEATKSGQLVFRTLYWFAKLFLVAFFPAIFIFVSISETIDCRGRLRDGLHLGLPRLHFPNPGRGSGGITP